MLIKGSSLRLLTEQSFLYVVIPVNLYITLWISRCIATAKERIPGSIGNYVTGVSECSQQRGNLKDDGYSRYYRLIKRIECANKPVCF
ncbi:MULTISPECIES: hypothetical protein [Photorhabdus]|uniref:hypothetical protein n=1 Tax=Photorhabdus TaxID=29487 RepID=UPI001E5E1758|nr:MULTISPECIES: hypothetical protein [Photorhabdus]MCT8353013.1 hypothetical protein [Photorhabdus kayaii]